jgi:ATP-binding cassette subfamily B protein
MSAFSHETVSGLQTIQSFGYEAEAGRRFGLLADDAFHAARKYIRTRAFLLAFVIGIVFGAIGIVLWAGGHKVLAGEMSGGDLSAFIFYSAMVAGAVTALSEAASDFHRAAGAADRITGLLSTQPAIAPGQGKKMPAQGRGAIEIANVSFRYPARPEHLSLDRVTIDIPAGKVTALVGPSGAGKSTIFQLLQRFYDPQQGRILIDGMDIHECDPREVRRLLGVVAQDPVIFSTSIAENIRMGDPAATDAEVREAAELAQAHEFIAALPEGYDTLVGERGSRLSGGQRQRVAIARALLKNPRILLLDEATSALDASNELAVHMALKALMKGRTTLIIAHRLSTVQGADKIVVMDKGRVVAEGDHASLFGSDSLYTHLAGLQMDVKTA